MPERSRDPEVALHRPTRDQPLTAGSAALQLDSLPRPQLDISGKERDSWRVEDAAAGVVLGSLGVLGDPGGPRGLQGILGNLGGLLGALGGHGGFEASWENLWGLRGPKEFGGTLGASGGIGDLAEP